MTQIQIVQRFHDLHLLKVGHNYHVVQWLESENLVGAIYSGDRVKGKYLKAEGFEVDSIRIVSKPRKKETATAYYNELRRKKERMLIQDAIL